MIVRQTQTGWEIIYHRAHALLAAQIAGHWQRKTAPPRIYETIATISHHDDLEREWEGNHLTAAGTPLDFMLESETPVEKLADQITSSRYRGRWVALLTSIHLYRLNIAKRGTAAELDRFLDEQLELQKNWRKELKITKEEVDAAYAFMQWCDRLSLILCQGELPADERALEISKGPDDRRYDIVEGSDGRLRVTPWPFEEDEFVVTVEASTLSQVQFADNESFVEALQQAPLKALEWTFAR